MIESFRFLPETGSSHIFCRAQGRCQLETLNYKEEEYLFEGRANIYGHAEDGSHKVLFENCHYTNRMIVRRPDNLKNASGRVVVEILNSTANFDIDRIWADAYRLFTRNGDIYIGITSKPNVFPALQRFDAERYGALSWPNPFSVEPPDYDKPPVWTGPKDQEIGYIWDILHDLPALLKNRNVKQPLSECKVSYVYLSGWSQSCSYMTTYIKHFESEKDAVYDGYLAAGGVHSLGTPLNRYEMEEETRRGVKERRVNNVYHPLIEMNTESEASNEWGLCGYDAQCADSDNVDFMYRYMDIAGGCHDAVDSCFSYLGYDADVKLATGEENTEAEETYIPNNYRKKYAFHVAFRNLYMWAEAGMPPKSYARMKQNGKGEIQRDVFGNAIGGLRTPMIDYPLCRYYSWSEQKDLNVLAGHEEYFSSAMLKELYINLDNYMGLITKRAKELVASGELLKEDLAELIQEAADQARKAGLE